MMEDRVLVVRLASLAVWLQKVLWKFFNLKSHHAMVMYSHLQKNHGAIHNLNYGKRKR